MNKRKIILDFTSLLDVIMIILFFFILFSHIETIDAKTQSENAMKQAEELSSEAKSQKEMYEDKMQEAAEKNKKAEEYLTEAGQANERTASNVKSINEFSNNINLKIYLKMNGDNRQLDVYRGDDDLAVISVDNAAAMKTKLADIISGQNYEETDTILCEFIYNASLRGTKSVHDTINEMFSLLKTDYTHFFYSEVDTSIGEE